MADAILVRVDTDEDTGASSVHPITTMAAAADANHYVACLPSGADHHDDGVSGNKVDDGGTNGEEVNGDDNLFAYYLDRGQMAVPTVTDGDCAFDVMCVMAGEERTAKARADLRFEVADYLMRNPENAALHRVLKGCLSSMTPTMVGMIS